MNLTDTLKEINIAKFTPEQEKNLKETLGGQDYEIGFHVIRNSWILSYEVPQEYHGGRCIQGNLEGPDGPEAEVMFPHSRDREVQKISRGDSLRLQVRYNHFDKLFSRACFLDLGSVLVSDSIKSLGDPTPVHYYLANILAIVYADGKLAPEEDQMLKQIKDRLKLKQNDLDIALKLIANGDYDCKLVGSYSQQIQNLEDMLRICLSDGELHDYEQQWVTHFSGMIGLDQATLDQIYQSLEAGF
jgi:uncharacterized tellurite resistance protein B-like protein